MPVKKKTFFYYNKEKKLKAEKGGKTGDKKGKRYVLGIEDNK